MTESINSYIKDYVITHITDYEMEDFSEDVGDIIHWGFNESDDNWNNYEKPRLDEFMTIQHIVFDYLNETGGLDYLITREKRTWKWWFNVYAISNQWIDDWDELKERCFEEKYDNVIVNFQSNIRRRQATIKVIKKLHLTGSL